MPIQEARLVIDIFAVRPYSSGNDNQMKFDFSTCPSGGLGGSTGRLMCDAENLLTSSAAFPN
jgi:hypothetical protein